jgi:putative oxidoreductase
MAADSLQTVWAPRVLSILRIIAALIFMEHGTSKLLGFPPSSHSPEMWSLPWIAGLIELVGGALLVVGFFTRPVALILSGEMAFAYWMAHAPQNFYPVANGGDALPRLRRRRALEPRFAHQREGLATMRAERAASPGMGVKAAAAQNAAASIFLSALRQF